MSLPDWEEEAAAQKTLLSISRNNLKRRAPLRRVSVGSATEEPESATVDEDPSTPSLKGDGFNVTLLLFLYVLQGTFLALDKIPKTVNLTSFFVVVLYRYPVGAWWCNSDDS